MCAAISDLAHLSHMTQFPPSILLALAMENHTLWTYLVLKLLEICTNHTYSMQISW